MTLTYQIDGLKITIGGNAGRRKATGRRRALNSKQIRKGIIENSHTLSKNCNWRERNINISKTKLSNIWEKLNLADSNSMKKCYSIKLSERH
jgi:hypothetical protein